jgi:hypothetical protein
MYDWVAPVFFLPDGRNAGFIKLSSSYFLEARAKEENASALVNLNSFYSFAHIMHEP